MSVQEVIYYVVTCGGHLEIPLICPKLLKDELIKCWSYEPNDRPSFHHLVDEIKELLRDVARSDSPNPDDLARTISLDDFDQDDSNPYHSIQFLRVSSDIEEEEEDTHS